MLFQKIFFSLFQPYTHARHMWVYGRYAPEGRAQKFRTDDVSLPWERG